MACWRVLSFAAQVGWVVRPVRSFSAEECAMAWLRE